MISTKKKWNFSVFCSSKILNDIKHVVIVQCTSSWIMPNKAVQHWNTSKWERKAWDRDEE